MRRLREAVEGLDVGVLVNNAGVARPCAVYLHEADVEAWMRMIRVNLWALTEMTAAVLPGMVQRGRGAVVKMGSASSEAIPSFPLYTMYAGTKRPRSSWRPGWCRAWRRRRGSRRSCRPPTPTPARRRGGSGTAHSAPPPWATSCCGASPPSCRTPRTTGCACARTCGRGRRSRG
uniref:SDR family NAD(P)-dependent oxidoreductase n=1 Tax=Arundo donax TaxID=35708 RepID=A0A0A9CN91_ARUDO